MTTQLELPPRLRSRHGHQRPATTSPDDLADDLPPYIWSALLLTDLAEWLHVPAKPAVDGTTEEA